MGNVKVVNESLIAWFNLNVWLSHIHFPNLLDRHCCNIFGVISMCFQACKSKRRNSGCARSFWICIWPGCFSSRNHIIDRFIYRKTWLCLKHNSSLLPIAKYRSWKTILKIEPAYVISEHNLFIKFYKNPSFRLHSGRV